MNTHRKPILITGAKGIQGQHMLHSVDPENPENLKVLKSRLPPNSPGALMDFSRYNPAYELPAKYILGHVG